MTRLKVDDMCQSIRLPFEDDGRSGNTENFDDSAQTLVDKTFNLKPVQDEFLNYVKRQDSLSQLSLMVNDSAKGDKTFDEVYEMGKVLGEGGFAFVYQCQHRTNHHMYAVKEVLKRDYQNGSEIKQEIAALRKVKECPHFVRLLDVFESPNTTYLIMEEMKGGDLLDKLAEIEVYEEWEARKLARTLLEAINYCHQRKIAHRDIKPENILLPHAHDITRIKLADFGCAKEWDRNPNDMHTLCGSPQYVAPEVVGDTRAEGEGYNFQCDLWSCGVVLYIVLGGYAPFESEDEHELLDLICNAEYEFHEEYWDDIEVPPKELISQLLEINPKQRLTARQALRSPWLRRRDRDWLKEMDDSNSTTSTFGAWLERMNSSRRLSDHNSFHDSVSAALDPDKDAIAEESANGDNTHNTDNSASSSGHWDDGPAESNHTLQSWFDKQDEEGSFAEGPLSPGRAQESATSVELVDASACAE